MNDSEPLLAPWYRLGYVIPHLYTDMDAYQFYRVAPEGMMLVTTGLDLRGYSVEAVECALPTLGTRLDLLAAKKVDRIALSGVPVAAALGRTRMLEILREAEDRTGIASDTDLEAHIGVLRRFGASRIALATRWPAAVNEALMRYLREADIEVIACRSCGRSLDQNKAASAEDDHHLALELGREALRAAPDAQALLLPGGLWNAIHAVPLLEREFEGPVLLNILSTLRGALDAAGERARRAPDPRWGRVLGRR